MDNRLIPKWDTSIVRKRRKYKVIKTEDFERYQRIIAHYDEELNAANSCIRDIYNFCIMVKKSHLKNDMDLIKDIKNKIKKYYVETDNYSEENVKCLIEGREIEAEDIQMNNEAKMVTIFDKCFLHLTNGTTIEYRNGELGFYDGLLSIWGDIYDGTVTSPVHHTYKREEYEKVEVF